MRILYIGVTLHVVDVMCGGVVLCVSCAVAAVAHRALCVKL